MNCIIPGLNLKVIAKALHALAKVGDDLYIEAKKEKITLISLNLRKTICVRCYLLESFFSSYDVNEDDFNDQTNSVTCKIHMKTLLPLFKGTHLEKKFDFIKIEYESSSDLIIFKMKYKCDDILMTHKLRLMEPESLTIEINSDSGSNNILTSSSFYNQLLSMFSISDDEITLEIDKQKVVARNYCVGAPIRPKSVRSQVNLNGSEFTIYDINNETVINFSLKPLRTAIQFADSFNLNMGLNFQKGGKPLEIIMKNPTFGVNFVVATLNPYSDLQTSMTTASIPTKITQHTANITTEDQEALQNENWQDFEANINEKIQVKKLQKTTRKSTFREIMEEAKYGKTRSKENVSSATKKGNSKLKSFTLPEDSPMDIDEQNDVIPDSPESPRAKKAKIVFGRCFESTFSKNNFTQILAPNSDSE